MEYGLRGSGFNIQQMGYDLDQRAFASFRSMASLPFSNPIANCGQAAGCALQELADYDLVRRIGFG
jgi:hypothetical protein